MADFQRTDREPEVTPDIVRDIEESRVPEAEAYEALTPETAESGQDNGLSQ